MVQTVNAITRASKTLGPEISLDNLIKVGFEGVEQMNGMSDRAVNPQVIAEDRSDKTMRPQGLIDFIGQRCGNLSVFVNAAKKRSEALDHTLLFGPLVWARLH